MKNWSSRIASLAVAAGCLGAVAVSTPAEAAKTGTSAAMTLPETKSEAPVLMLVSLDSQSIRVFSGDTLVARSHVSTGKKGHATPTGVFSVLQKKRRHHSNIYSRAPMPFMQRLTWSGIALHEAKSVPNTPASHGCVRLPRTFAKQLYRYTDLGAHVIITDKELDLRPLPGKTLFDRKNRLRSPSTIRHESASVHFISAPPASVHHMHHGDVAAPAGPDIGKGFKLRAGLDGTGLPTLGETASPGPVRIQITRRTGRELVRDIQKMLNTLGFEAGETDGWMGPETGQAIIRFQKEHGLTPTGTLSIPLAALLHQEVGGPGFASGHIYVRQAGKPLFDAPVILKTPGKPLGTHFLSALPSPFDPLAVQWFGMTLADTQAPSPLTEITEHGAAVNEPSTIGGALGRIELPDRIRKRIERLAVAGSSLVISDHGISPETLRGTDFVVLTNEPDRQ